MPGANLGLALPGPTSATLRPAASIRMPVSPEFIHPAPRANRYGCPRGLDIIGGGLRIEP
jgi:hypothetical protein